MTDDLETLRPEVAEAVAWLKSGVRPGTRSFDGWSVIRAELLRLAEYEQAAGRLAIEKAEFRQRAEKAEAELAALKARILPGAAKVEIADTDDPDGNPYGWVGGTLLSHNLIGKRVRLLVVEE